MYVAFIFHWVGSCTTKISRKNFRIFVFPFWRRAWNQCICKNIVRKSIAPEHNIVCLNPLHQWWVSAWELDSPLRCVFNRVLCKCRLYSPYRLNYLMIDWQWPFWTGRSQTHNLVRLQIRNCSCSELIAHIDVTLQHQTKILITRDRNPCRTKQDLTYDHIWSSFQCHLLE